jgi:hypothetical protein
MTFNIKLSTIAFWFVLGVLLGCLVTCNCSGGSKGTYSDTVTHWVLVPDSMQWRQDTTPDKVADKPRPTVIDTQHVVKTFYESVFYKDTFEFKYGRFTVDQVMSENRRDSIKVTSVFNIPEVTITKQAPKRNEVWIGVNGIYSPFTLAAGPSLEFAHKRGWGVNIGAYMGLNGQVSYGVGFKRKLSFK